MGLSVTFAPGAASFLVSKEHAAGGALAVVIGSLVTSTLLTLLVLPSIYPWFAEEAAEAA